MNEIVTVRNTLNGQVAQVRRNLLDNPHLAEHYVEVDEGSKPMILSRPATAQEYISRRSDFDSAKSKEDLTSGGDTNDEFMSTHNNDDPEGK